MQPPSCDSAQPGFFRPGEPPIAVWKRSRGLTLIELLVVILIVGTLVALLIPTVQSAREAARSAQCRANLHQIGVAMHAYHAMHDMFPPGGLFAKNTRNYSNNWMSGFTYLLPFIENGPLYDSLNMTLANTDSASNPMGEHRTARQTRIALYLCPGDGGQPLLLQLSIQLRPANPGRETVSLL